MSTEFVNPSENQTIEVLFLVPTSFPVWTWLYLAPVDFGQFLPGKIGSGAGQEAKHIMATKGSLCSCVVLNLPIAQCNR